MARHAAHARSRNTGTLLWQAVFFFGTILYEETVFRLIVFPDAWDSGWLYMALFSVPMAILLALISACGSRRVNRLVATVLTGLLVLPFGVQTVYERVCGALLSFSLPQEPQAAFADRVWTMLPQLIPIILLLILPLLVIGLFGALIVSPSSIGWRKGLAVWGAFVVCQAGATATALFTGNGGETTQQNIYLYQEHFDPMPSARRFGLLTVTRLDVQRALLEE